MPDAVSAFAGDLTSSYAAWIAAAGLFALGFALWAVFRLGRQNAQLSLSFGVDDIDGTIDDTTKIYSMAGSEEQTPSMTTEELVALIKQVKRQPVERDTLYNVIKDYGNETQILEA